MRKRLQILNMRAHRVQGFFRMKWMMKMLEHLRRNVIILQRGTRRFLARRDIIRERLVTYLSHEVSVLNNVKAIEQFQLF